VFGLSFGELCVLVIVTIVVIGPKDMPKVLRKAGLLAAKLRRMANDLRVQSGIDEALRAGGLGDDLKEIRKLTQGDFLSPATRAVGGTALVDDGLSVVREREYPREGADSYGALPDTAILYSRGAVPSPLATDPLYVTGDPNGALPPLTPPPAPDEGAPPGAAAP
jgi:sec-independent protein translocase protein TatB